MTMNFRSAIIKAFRKIGGVKHLAAWAEDNPSEFYKLAGRLLVQERPPAPPSPSIKGTFAVSTQLTMFDNNDASA